MARILLEVCVDDPPGIAAAMEGGADRVELCSALAVGGLSPSPGLIEIARDSLIPVMAMIRPRAGTFVWSNAEIACMETEIAAVRKAGLAGVVIGATRPDGHLDTDVLRRLITAAKGLDVTLHRAIDLAPDPVAAMQAVQALGIRRVLSSGGAVKARDGTLRLRAMQEAAPEVTVMPGSGLAPETVAEVVRALPRVTEVHASCSVPVVQDPQLLAFGFATPDARHVCGRQVSRMRAALDTLR